MHAAPERSSLKAVSVVVLHALSELSRGIRLYTHGSRLEEAHLGRESPTWIGAVDTCRHLPSQDPLHLGALEVLECELQNQALFADSDCLAERHQSALGDVIMSSRSATRVCGPANCARAFVGPRQKPSLSHSSAGCRGSMACCGGSTAQKLAEAVLDRRRLVLVLKGLPRSTMRIAVVLRYIASFDLNPWTAPVYSCSS